MSSKALSLIKNRRTVYEFENKSINNSRINKILEAGRWAPSPLNKQPWKFIVIKDKKKISELLKIAAYGAFHKEPTLVILLVLDGKICRGTNIDVKDGKVGIYEGYLSLGMAAQNMVLTAEDLGIKSAILTPEQNKIKKMFKLKNKDIIPLYIGFGYEKKDSFKKKRTRHKLKELVKYEKYK